MNILHLDKNPAILVVGSSRSGKTYFLNQLFKKIRKNYDIVFYINPTKNEDLEKYLKNYYVYNNSDEISQEDFMKNIVEKIKNLKKSNPKKKILLWLDDIAYLFSNIKYKKKDNILDFIFMNLRHYATLIMSIQTLKSMPMVVRKENTHVILCKTNNRFDFEDLYKLYNMSLDKEFFYNIMNECFKEEYRKILISHKLGEGISFIDKDLKFQKIKI